MPSTGLLLFQRSISLDEPFLLAVRGLWKGKIECRPMDLVGALKDRISDAEGGARLPRDRIRLTVKGKVLTDDSSSLTCYSIDAKSKVAATKGPPAAKASAAAVGAESKGGGSMGGDQGERKKCAAGCGFFGTEKNEGDRGGDCGGEREGRRGRELWLLCGWRRVRVCTGVCAFVCVYGWNEYHGTNTT